MLPAAHRGNGDAVGAPDVCNTPSASGTVTIPYVNTGQNSSATGFSNIVMIVSQNALKQSSSVSTTSGDEAGSAHYSTKGTQTFSSGNPVVLIEGNPAITLSSATSHNKGNCPAGVVTTPSVSTTLFTFRQPELGVATTEAMWRAVARPRVAWGCGHRGTLWLRPACFSAGLAHALERIRASVAHRRCVFDLRGNPGGLLASALEVAHSFAGATEPTPLAIEVDGGTASAAEIAAAWLASTGRARIIGTRTAGKGTVHRLRVELRGQAPAYPVVGEILVGGRRLHGVGLRPAARR